MADFLSFDRTRVSFYNEFIEARIKQVVESPDQVCSTEVLHKSDLKRAKPNRSKFLTPK